MENLSSLLTKVIGDLGGDAAKVAAISRNSIAYKQAIKKVWPDEAASQLILDHTNAFYIRVDERPKKGPDKDKVWHICEIVCDDPLVRSEIDTHRELIFLHLKTSGLDFEEIKIIPAKGNMRNRHPFSQE